jgi:hypothetical protein
MENIEIAFRVAAMVPFWVFPWVRVGLVACLLGWVTPSARAILFLNSDDPSFNNSAPGGSFSGSGWQHQGYFGNFLATMVGPRHLLTAQHIGTGNGTFIHDALFNGTGTVSYTINALANGGLGYWDIPGSDLRLYEVDGTFSSWATLADSAAAEAGLMVTFGRGGVRGDEVELGSSLRGWELGAADGVARWGTNMLEPGVVVDGQGRELLRADFDGDSGALEAHFSVGDSGGGAFVFHEGQWKLVGVNYAVDGLYDFNDVNGDGSEFSAALFNSNGFFIGSDSSGWSEIGESDPANTSSLYVSRVSSSASVIQGIVGVPEPGALAYGATLMMLAAFRRQRGACIAPQA